MSGDNEFQAKSAAAAGQRRQLHARSSKFIKFPFEVRIDGAPHDQYYDLRDATASARVAKRKNPISIVVVADVTTDERERIKALERENRELGQANEILCKASAYFAQAELDRRFKP